jgi:hypothetical protein
MSQKCIVADCPEFSEGDTSPPLCALHLDLDILVDFTLARQEQPTLKNIQKNYLIGRSNSDFWTLTYEQIPAHLNAVLAARLQTAE